jgi:hypothetical protein
MLGRVEVNGPDDLAGQRIEDGVREAGPCLEVSAVLPDGVGVVSESQVQVQVHPGAVAHEPRCHLDVLAARRPGRVVRLVVPRIERLKHEQLAPGRGWNFETIPNGPS